jgi:hypothetical protein
VASRAVSVPDLVGKNKLTAAGQLVLSGQIAETLSTGTRLDDWAPSGIDAASGIVFDCSVATAITGIVGGALGRTLYLVNRQSSAAAVTLTARDANSVDGNRFGMDADLVLANGDGALFVWSPALSADGFWRCVGTYTPTAFDASGAAASALSAAEAYADSGDASTLATAEVYADTGDALALQKSANLSDVADQQTALDNLLPASPSKGDILVYDGTHWVKHASGANGSLVGFNSSSSDGLEDFPYPSILDVFNPAFTFFDYSDCCAIGTGIEGWVTGGTATSILTGIIGRKGIYRTSITSGIAGIAGNLIYVLGGASLRVYFGFRCPFASTPTNRLSINLGLRDNITGAANDGIYLQYTDNINSGAFQLISAVSGVFTSANGSTVLVAGTWYDCYIDIDAAGNVAELVINGSLECTVNASLTTAPLRKAKLLAATSGVNHQIDMDYFHVCGAR